MENEKAFPMSETNLEKVRNLSSMCHPLFLISEKDRGKKLATNRLGTK